ncbi:MULTISPECIES: aminopeptidase P family protein [Wolbachia]|uniref:aminopeptidase P family protein n=1 Tax=Wolbachia TaxID=953 RepID=UPI000240444E|nr:MULTISPECIES: aminopeptidase P family protein [Wolbachia]UYC23253.1 aminopeptidase P family protein [Wolbachia endosymbiont of Aedes aegypti]QBB83538.1 aminopeptidase P family protein [Wolbachia pipientis wAlbB]QDW08345.1 aminopeptidase P family protein [Wolbachia pipientis]QDW09534.1 aminopeptidase P family protein [Wolbachia pipientis]QZA83730.1 aminopeptidase P family protein [Wolbachia pipientis]
MSKIEEFRSFMHEINVDAFMLHTKDEYLNEYSKELAELCGFTGTNGLLIVTKSNKCPFFTDGRYITQARSQLDQGSFRVYNIQEEDPHKWVKANLTLTTSLGYYLQYFTMKDIRKYEGICKLVPYLIKKDSSHKAQTIVSHVSGESSKDKCERVAKNIEPEAVLLTDPNSISWLLNLRNESAEYTPCILGRAILYKNGNVDLFIQDKEHSTIEANFDDHINVFDISELENSLHKLNSMIIDPTTTPMSIMAMIKNKQIIEREDPCLLHKAVKNQTEITGAISAHIKDGVAVTNFLYWLIDSEITELEAEAKILEYRKEQNLFKQPSFPTISAFNENGAIIHYRASNKTNKAIKKDGLYLIDSGGQYLDGTTDVTRTVAIGDPTNEQRAHYTIVLKAHIALASAVFPSGTTGGELDILARIHLWNFGMDYMHGTGHGVGSYLSVHEGPQAISKGNKVKLMPGMILSNEPGYYIPGKYGIRIENLMYVEKQENSFLIFKQLTSVPYDKKLIDVQMLIEDEIKWINSYHQFVYRNLKNSIKDKEWLKSMCDPLK